MQQAIKYLTPLIEIEISKLVPHPRNKELFEMIDIESIADSIKKYGIIEPVVIRPIGKFEEIVRFSNASADDCLRSFDKFYICAGHRRVEAAKKLNKMKTVPARIAIPLMRGADEIILIHENLKQRTLSPETVIKATEVEKKIVPIEILLSELPQELKKYYEKGIISEQFIRVISNRDDTSLKEVMDNLKRIEELDLGQEIKTLKEYELLKKKLEEKDEEISKLLLEKESLRKEKEKLEREKAILRNSLQRLDGNIKVREEKIRDLQAKLSQLKTELKNLNKELSGEPSPEIARKIKENEEKIRQITALLSLKEGELETLKKKMKEEKAKYEALKNEMQKIVNQKVQDQIENIKREFQNILLDTRKQLEHELAKEREEKQRLLEELQKVKKSKHPVSAKPSQGLTSEERAILGLISHAKSFALTITEQEDVLFKTKNINFELYKEAVITLYDLHKSMKDIILKANDVIG